MKVPNYPLTGTFPELVGDSEADEDPDIIRIGPGRPGFASDHQGVKAVTAKLDSQRILHQIDVHPVRVCGRYDNGSTHHMLGPRLGPFLMPS